MQQSISTDNSLIHYLWLARRNDTRNILVELSDYSSGSIKLFHPTFSPHTTPAKTCPEIKPSYGAETEKTMELTTH